MKAVKFLKPIEEPINDTLSLHVTGASLDRLGQPKALIEAWNGSLLFTGLVPLAQVVSRQRFAKQVVEQLDPEVATTAEIDAALIRLSVALPRHMEGPPPDEPATTADDRDTLYTQARSVLEAPDVLDQIEQTLRRLGLVGERNAALLVYLAALTRLFAEPVSVIVKGPSSGGKSFLLKKVIELLPPSAFVDYTSVSPKYLAFSEDDLRHRIVVMYEAGGVADDTGAYIMRSLLSEGALKIGTVDKDDDGRIAGRSIEQAGPTALFTSTTRASLDGELETRTLSITITDTREHSRAIIQEQAAKAKGQRRVSVDLTPFHALQEWLSLTPEPDIRIPFAATLGRLVTCDEVRIRRDFPKLVALTSACALLRQVHRERDADEAILATLDDYATVRELLAESFAAAQQDGLTDKQRDAVNAVVDACGEQDDDAHGVSLGVIAKRLGIGKSSASRRLSNPLRQGYLRNLHADKKGQPGAYVPGEPLPDPITALPSPEAVQEAWAADAADAEAFRDLRI